MAIADINKNSCWATIECSSLPTKRRMGYVHQHAKEGQGLKSMLGKSPEAAARIRVLVVDDSAVDSRIIANGLERDPGISVVSLASCAVEGLEKALQLRPDLISLDFEMPDKNGMEFLQELRKHSNTPVVVVTSKVGKGSSIALKMLREGAYEIVPKPGKNISLAEFHHLLRRTVKMAVCVDPQKIKEPSVTMDPGPSSRIGKSHLASTVIAVGASTGGTGAVAFLLKSLPVNIPGIVLVQHMLAGHLEQFARQLDKETELEVLVASNHDSIRPGRVLLAPGDQHMRVVKGSSGYFVTCEQTPRVNNHRPSVDVLMESVASSVGKNSIGVMLTGMGMDGAEGMLKMKMAGARNLAQDEVSSVVYGMPKAAADIGAVDQVLSLKMIPRGILSWLA
jgi:two-component system, chemotaxis family, protein-glutamate methylesterase/glutaminase